MLIIQQNAIDNSDFTFFSDNVLRVRQVSADKFHWVANAKHLHSDGQTSPNFGIM